MLNKKQHISFILITALILAGLFSYQNQSYGSTTYTDYETTTHYRLDTGATFLWKNSVGEWVYNDWSPGDEVTFTYSHTIDKDAKNVMVAAYQQGADYGEEGYFPFEDTTKVDSSCIHWNATALSETKYDFYANYYVYSVTPSNISINSNSTGTIKLNYDVTFNAIKGKPYNVKEKLSWGEAGKNEIIALLGNPTESEEEAMDLMNPESENYNSTVEGWLYFIPIVIQYDVTEEVVHTINDFEADLDVPTSAKAGEEYTVTDTTKFENESEFAESELYYRVDGGTMQKVEGWTGTTLGESINQTFDEVCTVTYTLQVWNIYGKDKSVSKTINITDGREITAVADLELPLFTFEGHTELAKDISTFDVDGVAYSATRAYAEDIATNRFKSSSSTVSISKLTDTKAECTFSAKGTYPVTLTVNPVSGSTVSDTESIEVRKTPYIMDNLSGFQKQNRKQILTATVATYPGKPLTDYSVTLKDKKTGNSVTLSPDNLQENNTTIKTRSVTMMQDIEKGFAYITVEFLTKTPSYFSTGINAQDFYYEINVEDSKGDTDTASKTFAVSPDVPPTAAISLDSAFLRNEGTNIATIKVEDVTVAKDGDGVERKWYYGATTAPSIYTDVSTMSGYSKLSFGTDKIVGFNAVGVGKFTTKLNVKEVWTEPTLEEYVTDSDYLTDTEISHSDVQNVAPMVSLELLSSTEQEVLLLANNDWEYQTLLNNKTALQQELLKNQIDGQIIIKKLIGNAPLGVTGIKEQLSYEFPAPIWKSGLEDEIDNDVLTADSEKTYLAVWTASGNSLTVPVTVHAYDPYSGEVWSYTTNKEEQFTFGNDDTGKYLYLIYETSNQTVVLDKRTGAVAGTINMALSDRVWLSDNLAFISAPSSLGATTHNLYAIDLNSLTKVLIDESVSAVSRVGGNLQYITKSESGVVRNILDMETLGIEKQLLVDTGNGVSSPNYYMAFCIDGTGKVVLLKEAGSGSDTFSGVVVYKSDNSLQKQISCPVGFIGDGYDLDISYTLDENGVCNHVMVWTEDETGTNTHSLRCINLNTGVIGSWSKRTDTLNDIGFSTMFEVGGKSYFYYNGWYYTGESGYWGPSYVFQFNGTTLLPIAEGVGKIGTTDENYQASDRIITSLFGSNTAGILQVKISSFPKTLAQETKELISKFCDKLTFLGDINTTADEIKTAAEAPRPAIKVTAAQNGYLSMSNQALLPNKKYYYEYEIKPLTEGTESKLNGIAAATGSTTSSQSFNSNTLYVTNAYEEDFNSGTINEFFSVEDNGVFANGGFGAYYDDDSSMKLSFVVPNGKQAIVTMDMSMYFTNRGYDALSNNQYRTAIEYDNTNVFVDGNTIRDLDTMNNNSGSYYIDNSVGAVYYKILEAGTHSVECRGGASNWNYVLIDNLRVDILSTSPKTLSSTFGIDEGEQEDWISIDGSFETPNKVMSYGSQTSTTYYGGIAAAVTDTSEDDGDYFPQEITYYQTVPAGYIQKARVYFSGSVGPGDEVGFTPYNCGKFRYEERSSFSGTLGIGEWRSIGALTAGTYSHIADTQDEEYSYARMDTFDIVQYPYNAVTATGNMAFNGANTEYFFPKASSNKLTNLSIYLPKGEYLIKNLNMYYMEDGRKVYLQHEDCEELADLSKWSLSTGLSTSIVTQTEEEPDDEFVKIYKKGEKVLYNIFYSDYEKDPSKTGYWVYSHINWPPDTVHPDVGKILTAPIDRFYLSGKYTVTHWEVDNTQRTGTVGDATPYNKESNKVTMTFYVDGEGAAPWITYIKTNPSAVKENNNYTIQVGVDDTEKDTLALTTEVYLNGTLIKTDSKTGLEADSAGDYPEQTISGLPAAKVGVYQVICTVSDYSGVGIKSYKFIVVSEGKITGAVSHTVQWDANRKTYNLKRFSEEVNRELQLNDYIAMAVPRKRGTNVFWSGEQFVLNSETEGSPSKVTAQIFSADESGAETSTGYSAELSKTGKKTASGAELWAGNLWDESMINQWGGSAPEELKFIFTAYYDGGTTKNHTVSVIMDNERDYWQLHRLW